MSQVLHTRDITTDHLLCLQPKFFYGSLLFYFGVEISMDWLVHSASKLTRAGMAALSISFVDCMLTSGLTLARTWSLLCSCAAQSTFCSGLVSLPSCSWASKVALQPASSCQPFTLQQPTLGCGFNHIRWWHAEQWCHMNMPASMTIAV